VGEKKKSKFCSDCGDCRSKKSRRGYCGAYGGALAESAFDGSLESSAVGFMLVRLARIWLQSPLDVITFDLVEKKFYKFCTFNAICKDNFAINCIIVQHRKGSFPSTLTGRTTLVSFIVIRLF
jgi:hypothetical protein